MQVLKYAAKQTYVFHAYLAFSAEFCKRSIALICVPVCLRKLTLDTNMFSLAAVVTSCRGADGEMEDV
jgi:hypothetical protein